MEIKKRILRALTANALGQAITVASQLILTPLFFLTWGATGYGEWLILSTIPAYLMMADLGIGSAAANEMSMRVSVNNRSGAQGTFRGVLRVCGYISTTVILFSIVVSLLVWQKILGNTTYIASTDAALIIIVFGIGVSVNFYLGVLSSAFRCDGRNATSIFIGNIFRFIELCAFSLLLTTNSTALVIALTGLGIKIISCGVNLKLLKIISPWLFSPGHHADKSVFRRLIKPSLAFMAFPFGNALALQGPIIVIGIFFGPAMVAIFTAMRTLARVPYQITFAFVSSVSPEMTMAYGSQNLKLLRNLHRKSWLINFSLVTFSVVAIGFLGNWIVTVWLGKENVFNATVLIGLLITTALLSFWSPSSMVLTSTNNHLKLAIYYLIANGVGFSASFLLAKYFGIEGLVLSLIFTELSMLAIALPMALAISNDNISNFFRIKSVL